MFVKTYDYTGKHVGWLRAAAITELFVSPSRNKFTPSASIAVDIEEGIYHLHGPLTTRRGAMRRLNTIAGSLGAT